MSVRDIASIIGWEWRETVGAGGPATAWGYWAPPGCAYSDGSPPTVDDLLTWLADEGWCTDLERLIDHPTPVFVTLHTNYDHDNIDDLPMFTTALEACEAAVRRVAALP